MAYYSIEKKSKNNIEKKLVEKLGDRSLYHAYKTGNVFKILEKVALWCFAISFIISVTGAVLFLAGIDLPFLTALPLHIVFIILITLGVLVSSFQSLSHFFHGEAAKITDDMKYILLCSKNDKIEIAEYGVSNVYLYESGDDETPPEYHKDVVEKQDISEILHCEMLGAYVINGKVTTYFTNDIKAKTDPENIQWMFYNNKTALSLRLFDYWINDETGIRDIKEALTSNLGMPVKEIGIEEYQKYVKKDEILRLN